MVTMLYECGRLSKTVATQVSAADEAPADDIVNVAKPTAEITAALRTLPIFDTRSSGACLIPLTVMVNADRWSSLRMSGV
jgi:hypothetical protein